MSRVLEIYDGITAAMSRYVVSFVKKLAPDEPLTIAVNSDGGDLFEGVLIYNTIKRHPGRKVARVDAVAASAASYILLAADEIVMAPGSWLMIHDPSLDGKVRAGAEELESIAAHLRALSAQYAQMYSRKSALPEADIRKMMAKTTWLDAETAVKLGFADRVDETLKVAASVRPTVSRFKNLPKEIAVMAGIVSTGSGRSNAQKRKLRKRMIIARVQQLTLNAKLVEADKPRTVEDRRAERDRVRRRAMAAADRLPGETPQDRIARVMAEAQDLAERAEIMRRKELDYAYDHGRIPREQRRYDR